MSAKQLSLLAVTTEDTATRVARAAWATIKELRRTVPEFRMTEEVLVEALRGPLAKEMPKTRRVGKRDVLFDAVAHGFGYNGNITKAAAGAVAKAVKEVLEVDPTVSAEDLTRGCAYVRRKFETCGPMALSSNWHAISKNKTERTATARRDIYVEPPFGWREAAQKLYPDAHEWVHAHDWQTIQWLDVATAIRPEILRAMS